MFNNYFYFLVLAIISFPLAFAIYLVPYKQQSPKKKRLNINLFNELIILNQLHHLKKLNHIKLSNIFTNFCETINNKNNKNA